MGVSYSCFSPFDGGRGGPLMMLHTRLLACYMEGGQSAPARGDNLPTKWANLRKVERERTPLSLRRSLKEAKRAAHLRGEKWGE